MNKREQNRERWKQLIDEQASSGLSLTKFCEVKKLPLAQLIYYRQVLAPQKLSVASKQKVIPIHIQSTARTKPAEASLVRLTLQNGMQCTFPVDMAVGLVQQWVRGLLSC